MRKFFLSIKIIRNDVSNFSYFVGIALSFEGCKLIGLYIMAVFIAFPKKIRLQLPFTLKLIDSFQCGHTLFKPIPNYLLVILRVWFSAWIRSFKDLSTFDNRPPPFLPLIISPSSKNGRHYWNVVSIRTLESSVPYFVTAGTKLKLILPIEILVFELLQSFLELIEKYFQFHDLLVSGCDIDIILLSC